VKLVISDAHEGLKKAASKVLSATWQRCRVGSLKKWIVDDPNAMAYAGRV
jgi:putative transposase